MFKFYGVYLIKKVAYEQLDSLKDNLRRILKRPGLGSTIPWNIIRISFLLAGFLFGIIIDSVLNAIFALADLQAFDSTTLTIISLVVVPLTTLITYSFLMRRYHRAAGEVHEMNTFLVALGECKNATTKSSAKMMENIERKISKAMNHYNKQVLSLVYSEMKNDHDIKAFRRDYEKVANFIARKTIESRLPKKLRSWQKDLIVWGQQTYTSLLNNGKLWIWHDLKQNRITFNMPKFEWEPSTHSKGQTSNKNEFITFTTEITDEQQQILHYLDEMTISAFFVQHHTISSEIVNSLDKWMPQISTTLTKWTQKLASHFNTNNDNLKTNGSDEMDIFEASMHDPFADLTLLMINKLSGSAEILMQQARQKEHVAKLTREFLTTLEKHSSVPFFKAMREIFDPVSSAVLQAENQAEILRSHANQLIEMSMKLRDVQSLARKLQLRGLIKNPDVLESFQSLHESFLPFYQILEKIRFLTQWFEDIEHFTTLPGEIALESGTEEIKLNDIPKDAILVAKNLFKKYQGAAHTVYALRGVTLQVKDGEFIIITGPSGSGKTTLLNVLSGLDLPNRGVVILDGQNITKMNQKQLTDLRRDKMGFIFQFYNLLPALNAQENVAYPREIKGEILSARQRARLLLEQVGLGRFLKQTPNKLSGGQMQRVTIARSLENIPKIIFADEPTGDLDHVTGEQVMNLLKKFHQDGHTIILVTHDLSLLKYGTRWIEMRDGQIIRNEPIDNTRSELR